MLQVFKATPDQDDPRLTRLQRLWFPVSKDESKFIQLAIFKKVVDQEERKKFEVGNYMTKVCASPEANLSLVCRM